MQDRPLHPWSLTPKEAARVQTELSGRLVHSWDERDVVTVGGIDVSVKDDLSRAAIVILSFPQLEPLTGVTAEAPTPFPYVPGLLTFREGPVVLDAWARLERKPDLVLFDGQGIAHPRSMGIAAHMGLWLGIPTIGCAKSRLYGRYEEPGIMKGDASALVDERDPERAIGSVLRTRARVKPLFVSPGHLIDLDTAVAFTLECCDRYRLPEPTRWAHRVAGGACLLDASES
ncbi:MAG: deoxyribonuclease V [Candidatus Bipolaricaulia bacterium]